MMRFAGGLVARALICICLVVTGQTARAEEKLTIAAAADLKFALDAIIVSFRQTDPAAHIETIYGSSGNFSAQIRQGAPYDLYFSADIAYPLALEAEGYAASKVQTYAVGRIVLWSPSRDSGISSLDELAGPAVRKIAIANPLHAPYGKRAQEALESAGVWGRVRDKLVYGENVVQAAQFVQSGNAQAGIIALSLALSPQLAKQGSYFLIPDNLHQPLKQGYIITRRAAANPLAHAFARYLSGKEGRAIMSRYGFALPGKVE